ncbi:MAG: DUF2279 domain-containing protein [Flavobacteriales bacterium]|nr:DUF2279 domain-containing protein [Flavobacteriales bacterium]NQX96760.1 DUF2279 domain-containing protein [Flavobacteriales bacterium]
MLKKLLLILLITAFVNVKAQSPVDTTYSEDFRPGRLGLVGGGAGVFYGGMLTGLATVWYEDNHWVGFHVKNDNAGWLQIDKYGHAYTTYLMGKLGMNAMRWTGVKRKKAIWWGGAYGFIFMTSVELLDANYIEWGFSPMDMVANASGSLLLIGQELAFKKQILTYKFSYHHTELAQYRPSVLGDTDLSRVVADYNGQTFWLSLNLKSVFKHKDFLPSWLNVAGGYGAYGMLSAENNPTIYDNGAIVPIERYRSYYLSLDIDFDKIKTRSKFLKSTFFFLNMLKFPLPTFEVNTLGERKFHAFFF